MKRYLAFFFERYYPSGGMDDFDGSFDSLDEASLWLTQKAEKEKETWQRLWSGQQNAHVYDLQQSRIVWRDGAAV